MTTYLTLSIIEHSGFPAKVDSALLLSTFGIESLRTGGGGVTASAKPAGPKLREMTSLFAIFCTTALAPPMVVLGASSNEQRVQVTPEKPGTNVTCSVSTLLTRIEDGPV